MEYSKLAELAYKAVKHPSQWNIQDRKRIEKMEKILQREIEAELATVGLVATTDILVNDEVETKLKINKTMPVVENVQPMSLMERVFADQDENLNATILSQEPDNKIKTVLDTRQVTPLTVLKDSNETKRYSLSIVCSGAIAKPPFQIFKGEDIVDKDFQTDQIRSTQYVFYAVIDATQKEILEAIPTYFSNAYVSGMTEQVSDYIPPQYKAYWRDATKL